MRVPTGPSPTPHPASATTSRRATQSTRNTLYRGAMVGLLLCVPAILTQCYREAGAAERSHRHHQDCGQLLAERERMIQTLKYQRFDTLMLELGDIAATEQSLRKLVPPEKQVEFTKTFDLLTQSYHQRLQDLQQTNAGLRKENRMIQLELHLAKRKLRQGLPNEKLPNTELN